MYLYLHDYYFLPTGWSWDTITINPATYYAVSYTRTTFKLLKKPYQTNCLDYIQQTRFVSRYECITNCRIETSLEKCGLIGDETILQFNQLKGFARKGSDKQCIEDLNLDRLCWERCPNDDCLKEFFKATKFYEYKHSYVSARVGFRIPLEPQTVYNYRPKMETIEYLCYCASLTSLWFGFSCASIFYPIKHIVQLIDSRKSKRRLFGQSNNFHHSNLILRDHRMKYI